MNESDLNYRLPLTSPRGNRNLRLFEANAENVQDQIQICSPNAYFKYDLHKEEFFKTIKMPLTTQSLNIRRNDIFAQSNSLKSSFNDTLPNLAALKNLKNDETVQNKDDQCAIGEAQATEPVPNEGDMSMRNFIYSSDFKRMKTIQSMCHPSNGLAESNENLPNKLVNHTGEQKIDSAVSDQEVKQNQLGKLFTSEDSRLQLEEIKNQIAVVETHEFDEFAEVLLDQLRIQISEILL